MVTADHPFLDTRQLEAEATGLLDRMLGVLQDNSRYGTDLGPVLERVLTKKPARAVVMLS